MAYECCLSLANDYNTASPALILFDSLIAKLKLLANYTIIMKSKPAKEPANCRWKFNHYGCLTFDQQYLVKYTPSLVKYPDLVLDLYNSAIPGTEIYCINTMGELEYAGILAAFRERLIKLDIMVFVHHRKYNQMK